MKDSKTLIVVFCAIGFALCLKILLLDIMRVQGRSMEPTLWAGELLYVSRWAFGPQVPFVGSYPFLWNRPRDNDLVVFRSPKDGVEAVKRCVGVQGNSISVENNMLYIGTASLPLSPLQARRLEDFHAVPRDMVFVAGDNSRLSEDSRDYGFIPVMKLEGRVIYVGAASTPGFG